MIDSGSEEERLPEYALVAVDRRLLPLKDHPALIAATERYYGTLTSTVQSDVSLVLMPVRFDLGRLVRMRRSASEQRERARLVANISEQDTSDLSPNESRDRDTGPDQTQGYLKGRFVTRLRPQSDALTSGVSRSMPMWVIKLFSGTPRESEPEGSE